MHTCLDTNPLIVFPFFQSLKASYLSNRSIAIVAPHSSGYSGFCGHQPFPSSSVPRSLAPHRLGCVGLTGRRPRITGPENTTLPEFHTYIGSHMVGTPGPAVRGRVPPPPSPSAATIAGSPALAASSSIGCSHQKVGGVVPRFFSSTLHSPHMACLATHFAMECLRTCI